MLTATSDGLNGRFLLTSKCANSGARRSMLRRERYSARFWGKSEKPESFIVTLTSLQGSAARSNSPAWDHLSTTPGQTSHRLSPVHCNEGSWKERRLPCPIVAWPRSSV